MLSNPNKLNKLDEFKVASVNFETMAAAVQKGGTERGDAAHSKGFASSLAGSHVAKRMECVQLAGAFELAGPYESGSKLHAVQTLRGSRTGLLAHDGLQALPQDGDQFFMGGVGFRVGQGALGASVSEGVGHAFLAWRNVLAPEDVEQLD